jgi:DNA-binding NarL/FixJ family response regulator
MLSLGASERDGASQKVGVESVGVVVGQFAHLVRRGIADVLGREPGIRLFADHLDPAGLERAAGDPAVRVVIVSELAVCAVSSRLRAARPEIGVLVLASDPSETYGMALLASGLSCLDWDVSSADLIEALQITAAADCIFAAGTHRVERGAAFGRLLTVREEAVLELLCEGNGDRLIARELGISPLTVKSHIGHIREKLLAPSKQDLRGLPFFAARER